MEKTYTLDEVRPVALLLGEKIALAIKDQVDRNLKRDLLIIGAWESLKIEFPATRTLDPVFLRSIIDQVHELVKSQEQEPRTDTDSGSKIDRMLDAAATAHLSGLFYEGADRRQRQRARSQVIKQLRAADDPVKKPEAAEKEDH